MVPQSNLPKPPRPVGDADPAAAWNEVVAYVADKPALSWVKSFALRQLAGGVAKLVAQPGQRDMMKFVTTQRRDQLAQIFAGVLGSPVKIEIEAPAPPSAAPGSDRAVGGAPSAMQQALALPLVKQVMEIFDAQVVDVRPEGGVDADAASSAAAPPGATPPRLPGSEVSPFARGDDFGSEAEED